MPRFSNFQPIITVHDDGRVEVDFGDSYEGTYEGEAARPIADDLGQPMVDILDGILGVSTTPVERLRALADHLEAQDRPVTASIRPAGPGGWGLS